MLASLAKLSIKRQAGAHGVLGTRAPVPAWSLQGSCSTFPGRAKPTAVSRKVHQFAMGVEGTVTTSDSPLEVVRVPMFSDNYGWILRDAASGVVAVVDPGEAGPIQRVLKSRSWKLQYILNTHHHQDHVGGNRQLKDEFNCTVYGPAADEKRIPLIDKAVADGETFKLGETEFRVFDTPGHTRGHISYWAPQAKALFPGDTLFAMGCGRLFEGTPEQMWKSLSKLKALPEDTQIFCAHEYTENNAKWAVTVDPNNEALKARVSQVRQHRQAGKATVPALLADELKTNPFLRPDNPAIRAVLSVSDSAQNEEAFAVIRSSKDNF